jgi:hypothetical protein
MYFVCVAILKIFDFRWVGWYWLILCLAVLSVRNKTMLGNQSIPYKCEYYTHADGIGCTNQKFSKEKCRR